MTSNSRIIKIFVISPDSTIGFEDFSYSCTQILIGQTLQQIKCLKFSIEEMGFKVEILNAYDKTIMRNNRHINQVIQSYGLMAFPIIVFNGEVIIIGETDPETVVSAIKQKNI